jgi:hypothetical protein
MGLYDTVHGGFQHGQVKLWGSHLRELTPGDPVAPVVALDADEYSVNTSDGAAWVNVRDGVIVSVTAEPTAEITVSSTGMPTAGGGARQPSRVEAMLRMVFGPHAPAADDDSDSPTDCQVCAQVRRR